MIKTDEAEKTNYPQSIFYFSHCYERMKFKRKKKKKKLPITVTRLLNSHSVPLYVYLYSACQIGTSQSTLNWSF